MRLKTCLIAAAALIAVATPGLAHRNWLLPSATIFSSTPETVAVDAAESTDLFFPDHRALGVERIKVWAPDGSEGKIQNGSNGRVRSTFEVQLDKPGTWRIGMVQNGIGGTFKVDGVEWRLFSGRRPGGAGGPGAGAGRGPGAPGGPSGAGGEPPRFVSSIDEIPANATDIRITETSGSNNIYVTAGEPTDTVFTPTGKGLEMVPVTHLTELVKGEPARLKFLVDGKPAAGLKVSVLPGGKRYRDSDGAIEIMTGADGVATIDWPEAGMFWLNTSFADNKATMPKATGRRMSYTATLEVMAP
ncbi:DUF4198 domain-containing protein [Sphingobium nicotianae]|uniref:DUF4198 domain-containing protein n=1 Tax=Sphingobium nicotianae TaxID=2782607 RepID=A0A9X1DBG6_9SPHN|nr:DUF4198 domain-containing protein [Sphingobium nicotianae]MBT2186830.1 DUF4198 domain-containing protein [Sphingobium nicotianae]